jgi:transposase-like protein
MDDETRFWIAQEVAESKYKHDARKLFELGKKLMAKKPMTLITDGLQAYHDAYKKEFWTLRNPRTKHVRHITVRGDRNNNKMERFNGEIRNREKTMRGLKKIDTPILSGYLLKYFVCFLTIQPPREKSKKACSLSYKSLRSEYVGWKD